MLKETLLNRTFVDEVEEEKGRLPVVCNLHILKDTEARVQARVMDCECLYQILRDVEKTRKDISIALGDTFGDLYTQNLTSIHTGTALDTFTANISEEATLIEKSVYASSDDYLRSYFDGYAYDKNDATTLNSGLIRPWYTMIGVLWQAGKIFGVRLYDWLYDTCADYDIHSVAEQVKNKTVKITNLDWLVDAKHKNGELCCTQGNYADYTALDVAGTPTSNYHPLVLLGYAPERYDTPYLVVLLDYKGNVIKAPVDLFKENSGANFYTESFAELALTRGIANAVIAVLQKEVTEGEVTKNFTDSKDFLADSAKNFVKVLELEPYQQNSRKNKAKSGSDTFQTVLGLVAYRCRGNVYRRADWFSALTKARNVMISTLCTSYDTSTNTYIQVPYAGLHLKDDKYATRAGSTRIDYALSYKDTYYPALFAYAKPAVFDNKGRKLLVSAFGADTARSQTEGNAQLFEAIYKITANQEAPLSGSTTIKVAEAQENVTLRAYTGGLNLFNPGAVVMLSTTDRKGGILNRNGKAYSRLQYERTESSCVYDATYNSVITANVFKQQSNMATYSATLLLTGKEDVGIEVTIPAYAHYKPVMYFEAPPMSICSLPELTPSFSLEPDAETKYVLLTGSILAPCLKKSDAYKIALNVPSTVGCITSVWGTINLNRVVSTQMEFLKVSRVSWVNQDIQLPDTIQSLGYETFKGADIRKIHFPVSLKHIGVRCFAGCEGLTKIELPDGLEIIGAQAFSACTGLTEIVIPASVKVIYPKAFMDCIGLQMVVIEGSPLVADDAFTNCSPAIINKVESCCTTYKGGADSKVLMQQLKDAAQLYN